MADKAAKTEKKKETGLKMTAKKVRAGYSACDCLSN